jgi:hypothetical protein
MATQILTHTIEYDKQTQAWGHWDDTTLIRYHDNPADAIMEALPEDIATWAAKVIAKLGPTLHSRILRGAVIVATDRETPRITADVNGFYKIIGDSNKTYRLRMPPGQTCTCPDHPTAPWIPIGRNNLTRRHYCKHIFAVACYLAMTIKDQESLWFKARRAIDYKQSWSPNSPFIIWTDPKTHQQATLIAAETIQSDTGRVAPDRLYLELRGYNVALPVAVKAHTQMTDEPYWRWTATNADYKRWAAGAKDQLANGSR